MRNHTPPRCAPIYRLPPAYRLPLALTIIVHCVHYYGNQSASRLVAAPAKSCRFGGGVSATEEEHDGLLPVMSSKITRSMRPRSSAFAEHATTPARRVAGYRDYPAKDATRLSGAACRRHE